MADQNGSGLGVDLLRCESLLGLDPATCARVLNKNYAYVRGSSVQCLFSSAVSNRESLWDCYRKGQGISHWSGKSQGNSEKSGKLWTACDMIPQLQ